MSTVIPETVAAERITDWSDEVDVVVAGFGIAGGCAAVEAAARGARVLVLERAGVAGGTTALAGGHFYLGGGTAVQRATGHEDSAEEMYKYLLSVARDAEPEKIRAYCEGSVEHFDWLEGLGFEFERSSYPEKAVIQPGTQGLMYTGNEKVWPYREQAVPAPRGHKVPVPGDTQGAAMIIELLVKRASELGVEVRYETGVTNLVVDGSGSVVGVGWKNLGRTGAVRAKAVVLAAALGIPYETMKATLDRYNADAARGEDSEFHKAAEWLEPQDRGPWAAFDLTLGKALYAGFTLGGLRTSADGEVLRDNGSAIRGLYAAGATSSTLAQDGKGYSSGTQLGSGSFFGRRAGRHAASRVS
ncbi:FAD-dependent oxidoreductase [Nocardia seriolae]|uniref:3-oxosteroid 1-dehydrogenase n=1 Tax=Nocardia seriolae TaxID=37332 RepID=A0ABC8ARA7_9NOCA|nr:FAD-dependent oxidoreductase [Nocardia seriolae]APA96628.1 3-oxosteroid 1-dehydrogenase [Nocardia seriolae]OJF77864.1 hypothetical protein NS14008_38310 [Nocardia seriolae]PSK26937.1 FAD-binding protein [Nocardia seriolae]QOW30774.1 FAD-dependent oxidoreductase [Nocardia seriolae]QUN15299.1 FAD-dependent oxidoreductase [Nocardia seriolae]